MRKAHLLLMLIAIVGFVSNAEAKNRDKAWEFSGLVQHIDTDRATDVKNSLGGEFRFGYNFTAKIEGEFVYDFASTDIGRHGDDFVRALVLLTGNLLTDRETRTIPYVSAGLGVIQEKREGFTDGAGNRVLESFDASAILTIGVGARTFFNDNWGFRYEARYSHHDSFEKVQNEYVVGAGVTWIVGGQK